MWSACCSSPWREESQPRGKPSRSLPKLLGAGREWIDAEHAGSGSHTLVGRAPPSSLPHQLRPPRGGLRPTLCAADWLQRSLLHTSRSGALQSSYSGLNCCTKPSLPTSIPGRSVVTRGWVHLLQGLHHTLQQMSQATECRRAAAWQPWGNQSPPLPSSNRFLTAPFSFTVSMTPLG